MLDKISSKEVQMRQRYENELKVDKLKWLLLVLLVVVFCCCWCWWWCCYCHFLVKELFESIICWVSKQDFVFFGTSSKSKKRFQLVGGGVSDPPLLPGLCQLRYGVVHVRCVRQFQGPHTTPPPSYRLYSKKSCSNPFNQQLLVTQHYL